MPMMCAENACSKRSKCGVLQNAASNLFDYLNAILYYFIGMGPPGFRTWPGPFFPLHKSLKIGDLLG